MQTIAQGHGKGKDARRAVQGNDVVGLRIQAIASRLTNPVHTCTNSATVCAPFVFTDRVVSEDAACNGYRIH